MNLKRWFERRVWAGRALEHDRGSLRDLELWAISIGASACCVDVEAYQGCRIAGVVERLLVDPLAGCLEATVTDGTGWMTARWSLASGATRGLACGRRILLEGVAVAGSGGRLILDEPALEIAGYEFV